MESKDMFTRIAELSVAMRRLGSGLSRLGDPDLLMARVKSLEEKKLSFRREAENKASHVYPNNYVVGINIPAALGRVQQNFTVSQFGWFFADRIFASWLPAAGATANLWAPIGRSNPFIAGAGAIVVPEVANQINFTLEYMDTRTQQSRQNLPIPGDLLYRLDGDGYICPGGDPFAPNASVSIIITPTVAPTNAGVLYITFNGTQCHDVLPQ